MSDATTDDSSTDQSDQTDPAPAAVAAGAATATASTTTTDDSDTDDTADDATEPTDDSVDDAESVDADADTGATEADAGSDSEVPPGNSPQMDAAEQAASEADTEQVDTDATDTQADTDDADSVDTTDAEETAVDADEAAEDDVDDATDDTDEAADESADDDSEAGSDGAASSSDEDDQELRDGYFAPADVHNPAFTIETEVDPLLALLEKATPLVSEVRLQLTHDAIGFIQCDPANVALVDARLSTTAFDSFTLDQEGIVGVELQGDSGIGLYDALSQFDTGTTVTIDLDPEAMALTVTGDGLEFTLGPITPESIRDSPQLPDVAAMTDHHIGIDYSDLQTAVKATDMVADHVTISSDGDTVAFQAEGTTDSVTRTFDVTDLYDADLGEFEVIFALEYVKEIRRALSKGAVGLELGDGMPMLFDSEFATDDDDDVAHGDTKFMLAPRIQEE